MSRQLFGVSVTATAAHALRRLAWPLGLGLLLFAALLATWAHSPQSASASPAARSFAHDRITAGPYTLTVGWTSEPPYAGQLNGLELEIVRSDNGEPVTGAEATLIFEVEYGGQKKTYPLRTVFGEEGPEEGAYTADILPTQRGKYTFHFTGKIGDDAVDAALEVEEVAAPDDLQFPPAEAAPSTPAAEMASAAEVRALRADLDSARTLALAGLVAGVLGLVAAGAVWFMGRRSA